MHHGNDYNSKTINIKTWYELWRSYTLMLCKMDHMTWYDVFIEISVCIEIAHSILSFEHYYTKENGFSIYVINEFLDILKHFNRNQFVKLKYLNPNWSIITWNVLSAIIIWTRLFAL